MKNIRLTILLGLLISIISGCNQGNGITSSGGTEPTIYTTIYPLQFLTEEIAGDTFEVITVYPPGVDEHTYEPTAKELTQIAEGEAFIYIGAGLEAMATTTSEALANQDVRLIEIGSHEELFLSSDAHLDGDHEDHSHQHGDIDPHIWLDPIRMIDIAEIITDELTKLHPEESELFEANYTELQEELNKLHTEFEDILSKKNNPRILVTHGAFGYWEERYGIQQIAIHGLSTENEPSQKELINIISTAEEHDLDYIIFEQNVTTRVAEVIREEINATPLIIHNLAVLTEDDLAENRDYFSIMRDNLQVLDEALK